MKVFTYKDYIDCIHKLRLNAIFQLAEEKASYNLGEKQKRISLIKKILEDKQEAVHLINKYLDIKEKVKKEDLELYTNNYMAKKYNSSNLPLIYRQKNKETFFLIEHLDTIESNIEYKILNYCIDIIYEWSKRRKFISKSNYPKVVPIIIYTGKEKWRKSTNYKEKTIGTNVLENYEIDMQLNVIETDVPQDLI